MNIKKPKRHLFIILITSMAVLLISYFLLKPPDSSNKYLFSKLYEGELIKSLRTSGVINPRQVIAVGTQVSGIVEKVNVEENSSVKKGEIIASLDKRLFNNELSKNQANLDKIAGRVALFKIRIERLNKLIKNKFASADSLDEMLIQQKIEESNYALAKSELEKSIIQLNYTDIPAPIDGIILEKLVEPGQTVVASFTTPVLFKIAKNLSDMQITTKISEADIPQVAIGQSVNFTVDSFLDKTFKATVEKIKIDPNIQDGIVTYDVILKTNNQEGLLKPGMTANVEIILQQIKDARYILTDALRFASKNNVNPSHEKIIYVLENDTAVPVSVETGIHNDLYTQILKGNIRTGQKIIIGIKNDEPN